MTTEVGGPGFGDRGMSVVTKVLCVAGLVATGGLCICDWITSVTGCYQILGRPEQAAKDSIVVLLAPVAFATLCLAYQGTAGYWVAFFARQEEGLKELGSKVSRSAFYCCITYDWVSSVVGILAEFSGVRIHSWATLSEAIATLGGLGAIFAVMMGALLSLSPFLCGVFSQIVREFSE